MPPGDHQRILQAGDLYIARLSLDLSQPWQRVKVCIVVHYTYLFLVSRVYEQGFVAENVPPLSAWRPHVCQPSVR